jgi:hypothetical protein
MIRLKGRYDGRLGEKRANRINEMDISLPTGFFPSLRHQFVSSPLHENRPADAYFK